MPWVAFHSRCLKFVPETTKLKMDVMHPLDVKLGRSLIGATSERMVRTLKMSGIARRAVH